MSDAEFCIDLVRQYLAWLETRHQGILIFGDHEWHPIIMGDFTFAVRTWTVGTTRVYMLQQNIVHTLNLLASKGSGSVAMVDCLDFRIDVLAKKERTVSSYAT